MSRREIDIGIVGNDGTGDSIREAFRKVNDNFREIYGIFGQGDTIRFENLSNTPEELRPNRIITTDQQGTGLLDRILEGGDGIEIDAASDPNKIVINSSGTSLNADFTPTLAGPFNANQFVIANLKEPSQQAVDQFNLIYADDGVNITINDIAITKGYADRYYIRKSGGSASGQVRVRSEPLTTDEYTLTIQGYNENNAVINDHGFDSSIDGSAYVYNSTLLKANNLSSLLPVTSNEFTVGRTYRIETLGTTDFTELGALRNVVGEIFTCTSIDNIPNYGTTTNIEGGDPSTVTLDVIDGGTPSTTSFTEVINGGSVSVSVDNSGTVSAVYFIKYVDSNRLSFHPSFQDAQLGTNKILVSGGSGVQTLTDVYYDSSLSGNWVSNEVLPRNSVVRRQGDTMTGTLMLSDHPFPLQGSGSPNRPDDLQAATKYYVDSSSFASQVNLYVSTNGNDVQLDVPPGKEGRAWAYAYRTVSKACERAEYMMNNAAVEPGPYRQLIAYNDGASLSEVTVYTDPGIDGIANIKFTNNGGLPVDQGEPLNVELIPGKLIRGRTSGATGFIYQYNPSGDTGVDTIDLQYVSGEFQSGENLEFGDAVKNLHVTIHIESGIYEEDYPIKLPSNTAIVGDEFRRVLIRPKDRISQSPWIDTWFFRNGSFDGLVTATGGTTFDSNTSGYWGYHYLTDPSDGDSIPKNNKDIDVFLCNDTSIVRQVTCQGHGGFMMVLDPEGQILTKSPYCQQSGSFSSGINEQAFRGGQYIDGFNGNLKAIISEKISNTRLKITDIPRAPLTPTSFFIDGGRYKVDSWVPTSNARPNSGDLIKANKYFLQHQALTNISVEHPDVKYPFAEVERLVNRIIDSVMFDVTNGGNTKTIETTKKFFNRSDNTLRFTSIVKPLLLTTIEYLKESFKLAVTNATIQINQDQFTQIINTNRAGESGSTLIIENLMTNLYDCIDQGYSQLDNIDFPSFELVLDNETPLLSSPSNIVLITPGNTSMLSNDFTQVNDLGYGIVTNNNGLAECVSVFSYYCWTSMFSNNGGQIRSLNSSSANGQFGLVAAGSDPLEIPDQITLVDNSMQVAKIVKRDSYITSSEEGDLFIYVDNFEFVPYNVSIIEINHGSTVGILRYEMNNIQVMESLLGQPTIIKLNFNTAGNNDTSTSGLKAALNDGDTVIIRSGQNFKFSNLLETNPVRPSTALTYEGDPLDDTLAPVYRVISYNIKGPANENLPSGQAVLTTDTTYNYIPLLVDFTKVGETVGGQTLGANVGDDKIAITAIADPRTVERLNTGEMITAWDGKVHRIISYTSVSTYGYVTISDDDSNGVALQNLTGVASGLASSLDPGVNTSLDAGSSLVLRAGLAKDELANITVRISTMRATGHDFLDVGTGSYNNSNYPSKIYGNPRLDPNQSYEVQERTRGRVFYVSTDQDGFFRVGRFFTVDQGTGTVTFAASIALSNLDGLGFKKGIAVNEFSTDDRFTDLAQDAVPTEAAISTYIDRRLGMNRLGTNLPLSEVFPDAPGFIDRLGTNYPLADFDFHDFKIKNLGMPTDSDDAATKSYVDLEVSKFDTLNDLRDVVMSSASKADIMTFLGDIDGAVHATVTGDLSATLENANSTLAAPILTSNAALPGNAIQLASTVGFPSSGYVLIDSEVFQYNGLAGNDLTGVIRLSLLTDNTSKFKLSGATHSLNTPVYNLSASSLNYQINPNTIINDDVNANAGIVQSKLDMLSATTRANATSITQADRGLASFDSANFEATDGWIKIKDGGVARIEQENVTADRILGNLTASATYPQELTPEDILFRANWNAINPLTGGVGQASKDYVYTFFRGGNIGLSSFSATRVDTNVVNNALVKRTSDGYIEVNSITTDGGVQIISASGTLDNATPVTYKGQWSPGTDATFNATSANYATSAGSATTAGTANYSTSAGSITSQANSATITADSANTANTIVLRDASGNFSCNIMSGVATAAQYSDLAEYYTADKDYEPGTVLVFGGTAETTTTNTFSDTRVAGVVSTAPGFYMNSELEGIRACIALQGRVPCKVVGRVKKGDLLTTAATPGHAAKAINPKLGSIIGKALEDKDYDQAGIVEVAVGRT